MRGARTSRRPSATPTPSAADFPFALAIIEDGTGATLSWWNGAFEALLGPSARGAGSHGRDLLSGPAAQAIREAVGAVMAGEPEASADARVPGPDGEPERWIRFHVRPAGAALARSERLMVLAEDATELARARRRIAGVASISRQALAGAPLMALVQEALELVREVLGIEFAAFFAPGRDGPQMVAGLGWSSVPRGPSDLAGMFHAREITHGSAEPESAQTLAEFLRAHGVQSGLTIPLADADHGWLGVYSRRTRPFSTSDLHAVRALANLIGAAVVRQLADRELSQHAARLRDTNEQLATVLGAVSAGILVQGPTGELLYGNDAAARMTGRGSVPELLRPDSAPSLEVFDEQGRIVPRDDLPGRRALRGESEPEALLRVVESGRDARWLLVRARPVLAPNGAVRLAVVVLEDLTQLKDAQIALERRAAQEALIAELGQRALGGGDPAEVMAVAAARVMDLLGIDFVAVYTREPDGRLAVRWSAGYEPSLIGEVAGAGPRSHAGLTVQLGGPVVVPSLEAERRFRDRRAAARHGIRSGVSVLIGDAERPLGVLAVHARVPRAYSEAEVFFVQSVANVIAAALNRHAADDVLRRQAGLLAESRFEERSRLAREIHDGLAQDLWLARLKYARLLDQAGLDTGPATLASEVTDALEAAHAEAREAVRVVRGEAEAPVKFAESLRRTVEEIGERLHLDVELATHGRLPDLDPSVDAEVRSVVREALQNVNKHAGTRRARVRATNRDGQLLVEIADRGRGFEPRAAGGTFGLRGMRERAHLVGGELEVESQPGRGTTVRMRVASGAPG